MTARRAFLGGLAAGVASTASAARAITPSLGIGATGTVTLGVVAPFSGDEIKLGEQVGNGVRAAVDDANRQRGGLDRLFIVRTFDDQDLLADGIQNAGFAVQDESILCVIGHLSGRITDLALQTYAQSRMPVVVPASTYDRITTHGYGNVVRLPTKDSTEGVLAARYVNAAVQPKVALALTQDGDYGFDVAAGFKNQMTNDKVQSDIRVFAWDKPNFAGVAKETLALKPDALYLAGIVQDMGPLLHELRAAGYTGPIFASQGFYDPSTISKYGADANGLIVSASMPPLQIAPTIFRIKSDFEQRYGTFTFLSAFSYAAAQIAMAAISLTAARDREPVARTLTARVFNTVVGPLQFGPNGDALDPNVYFYTVRDGKWAYLKASHPGSFILK